MTNKEKITKLLEDYIKENLELKELELSKLIMKELEDLVNEKARKSSRLKGTQCQGLNKKERV